MIWAWIVWKVLVILMANGSSWQLWLSWFCWLGLKCLFWRTNQARVKEKVWKNECIQFNDSLFRDIKSLSITRTIDISLFLLSHFLQLFLLTIANITKPIPSHLSHLYSCSLHIFFHTFSIFHGLYYFRSDFYTRSQAHANNKML